MVLTCNPEIQDKKPASEKAAAENQVCVVEAGFSLFKKQQQ